MITNKTISACQRYNRDAQHAIYQCYIDRLFRLCLRYSRDPHEAKDVLHDSFIKIFTKIKSFKGTTLDFEKWITRITINQALENYRNQKKLVFDDYTLMNQGDEGIDPNVFVSMELEEIKKLVAKLPDTLRITFTLYVIDGFTHKEIASLLGIKESSSRAAVSRAKKILKKLISKSNVIAHVKR